MGKKLLLHNLSVIFLLVGCDSNLQYSIAYMDSSDEGNSSGTQFSAPLNPSISSSTNGSGVNQNGTETTLTWESGGEATVGYQIAYKAGSTAPEDCSSDNIITSSEISGTSHTVKDLTESVQYSFRICALNGASELSSGVELTVNFVAWELEVTTVSENEVFEIHLDDATDLIIDWGDGSQGIYNNYGEDNQVTHTYADAGAYTLKIRGETARINFANTNAQTKLTRILSVVRGISGIKSFKSTFMDVTSLVGEIPQGLFDNNSLVESFFYTFSGASGLTGSIPAGLFDNNLVAEHFGCVFKGATGLSGSIPAGLFDKSTEAWTFWGIFWNANNLSGSIPDGLFDNNRKVSDFYRVFRGATGLTGSIPDGLFDNNPLVTNFQETFYDASGLTGAIPDGLFDNNPLVEKFNSTFRGTTNLTGAIPSGLFDNNTAAINFLATFYNSGVTGVIPDNLFDQNTLATNFVSTFRNASLTGAIPTNLFKFNTLATSFNSTFRGLTGLTSIPDNLFDTNTAVTSFENTFNGANSLAGNVYDFWTNSATDFPALAGNTAGCFTDAATLANRAAIPSAWGGDGA